MKIELATDEVEMINTLELFKVSLNEPLEHSQQHMAIFQISFYCFGLAGICFGLALTSMLTAGIISLVGLRYEELPVIETNEANVKTENSEKQKGSV